MVVIDRHIAVFKEAHERGPVVQAVIDRAGDGTAIGHLVTLELKPQVQFIAQQFGASLSHGQPVGGAQRPSLEFHAQGSANTTRCAGRRFPLRARSVFAISR